MKTKSIIQAPMGEKTVLLHTCCAPCSSAIIEAMLDSGITPVIYYCNPNIYPQEEYEIRKEECTRYAHALGLEIVDADYDHDNWLAIMKGLENEPERGGRCLRCFKFRLLRTAKYAHERGIKVITTTLASSRWKSLDQINEAGRWACDSLCQMTAQSLLDSERSSCAIETAGVSRQGIEPFPSENEVVWWDHNWRKGGLQERRLQIIKDYDFYNQQYCGCEFSVRKDD